MKKKREKVRACSKPQRDALDELLEKTGVDEMGLLDLVFVEEILNQKKTYKSA